jgi:hypothetical protein
MHSVFFNHIREHGLSIAVMYAFLKSAALRMNWSNIEKWRKSSTLTNEIDDNLSLLGDGCSIIHHWLIRKNYLPVTEPT